MAEGGAMSGGSERAPVGMLVVRSGAGGVLMGLANLVPGISGGTMLLAAGVYPQFVRAVADVSTLKFRKRSLIVLAAIVLAALLAIFSFAGPVKDLVVHHRWMAYSVFIGLTLGGVPVVWRLLPGRGLEVWVAAALAFAAMAALAYAQGGVAGSGGAARTGFAMMFLAGIAGASAMVLPGISGGYLLLVLGVYVPILAGVAAAKDALKAGDTTALMDPLVSVVVPVGLGVAAGVVVVSNALKWLLARYERATLGVLLGLLVGAIFGLWPFQHGVAPKTGDTFKGQVLSAESAAAVTPDDYPTEFFDPTVGHVFGALAFVALGFAATMGIARMGRDR